MDEYIDSWQPAPEAFDIDAYGDTSYVYETPWYGNLWENTKAFASAFSGYGLQAYSAYQEGKAKVIDKSSITYQLPQSRPPERQSYVVQSGRPASAQASRVVMGGSAGGGINMNVILIGAVVLGAAFFMKGK